MKQKLFKMFISSSGILLVITALAKIISATTSSEVMVMPAPIVSISYRDLFIMAGLAELMVSICLLFGKHAGLQASLLAWWSTIVLIYRVGLVWIGYHKPCSCLGTLTDALHISPQSADTTMKIILAYLLIGSYATLFWLWRQGKKVSATAA